MQLLALGFKGTIAEQVLQLLHTQCEKYYLDSSMLAIQAAVDMCEKNATSSIYLRLECTPAEIKTTYELNRSAQVSLGTLIASA